MIDEVKECPNIVEYPKLELLQMASKEGKPILINFFQGMTKLKVLSLQELSIPKVPSLFQTSNNLRTLRIEDCQVEDVSIIGKELLKLEILSFANSNIKELPIEIGQLKALRLLDLTGCDDLCKFSSNVLTNLSQLEEFYFSVENFPWMQNNDVLIELKKISHQLKVVEIRLRKVELFPNDLIFENELRFWVYVVPYDNFSRGGYLESNVLQFTNVDYNSIKSSMTTKHLVKQCEILIVKNVKNLKNVCGLEESAELSRLKDLKISKCSSLEYLAEERAKLPLLNYLAVSDCSNLMYLIDGSKAHKSMIDFSNLVNMELVDLPSLIGFSKTIDLNKSHPSIPHGFSSTTELDDSTMVKDDEVLSRHIFTVAVVRAMVNLEKLEVRSCELMENLVGWGIEKEEDNDKDKTQVTTIMFNKLYSISLSTLPKFISTSSDFFELELPSLREFEIDDCPMLEISILPNHMDANGKNLNFKCYANIKDDGFPNLKENNSRCFNLPIGLISLVPKIIRKGSTNKTSSKGAYEGDHKRIKLDPFIDGSLFSNLTSLFIKACDKIYNLLSYSFLTSLEKLEVRDCKNMEEIISQEEMRTSENKITIFPRLHHLCLGGLPNLKAFCKGSYNFNFPSLQKVEIKDCPNMEVFSRGSSDTPMLEDVTIKIETHSSNYIQRKDLNATIQGFKAFVALQRSETLEWSKLNDDGLFGYFIKNSEMNMTRYHKLLVLVQFKEAQMLQLQHVRELKIKECDSLVEVFESGEKLGTRKRDATAHYELEKMKLKNLPKLRHIWKPNITGLVSFLKLTSITIRNCNSLKSLLSHSMARSLVQLQDLNVYHCKMMEEIVTKEKENNEGGSKIKILFPQLKTLDLSHLPNLECVCSVDYDYDIPLCDFGEDKDVNNKIHILLPQLQEFYLLRVPKLKCFSSGAYDYDIMMGCNGEIIEESPNIINVTLSTPNLHNVELQKLDTFKGIEQDEGLLGYITRESDLVIESCEKLLNCIPSNMSHLFSHLWYLTVRECGSLDEIFESTNDHYEYERDSIIQYELRYIKLDRLPKLKHIWKNHGRVLGFQNLTHLIIKQCHGMKYVFPDVSMVGSLRILEVSECNKMEEIVQSNSNSNSVESKEAKIVFPSLEYIKLEKLPNLTCFSPSSCSCYFELPECQRITVKECPKMETFSYDGPVYTPTLGSLFLEHMKFGRDEELNEVIRRRK
ncbi:uncharacterized protein LOC133300448 [Gastrolobium bilobum]|uniref:uncharacterized protein LOC133300448 n=1 Tax=Gastrolobium bilobum TaxID=150636 RepID=UPI002AB254CD|nr:uncharacterized protein LOC133300448 [Gastrolobium bilobum]